MMEEPVIETEDAKSEEMESTKIEELKAAIHDVLFAFEAQSKSINELRADLESFKKSASHKPLKEDKIVSTNFSDARYEVLKSMKEANKK
jgi:predicted RNase H-like nuclease (RuvC/YqgF family)